MLFKFFLGIGFNFHFGSVSARPFTWIGYWRDPSLGSRDGEVRRYWRDPSLWIGIGKTLHLDWISF
uniref:Uncharacterized protein n=1 Tax=Rhizophagus irregularis (strain DAOM 181602 / DAOM 197198 / MUCL 43194) TaxID=747089 RepID=U9T2J2_RHIID